MSVALASLLGSFFGSFLGGIVGVLLTRRSARGSKRYHLFAHDPIHPPLDFTTAERKRQASRRSN